MNCRARWSRSSRVRGALAPRAEVVRRADQPLPEQVLPDPVHRHAAGERIPRAGEPVGELRPAADVRPDLRRLRRDDRDEPARDRLSPVVGIAADADRDRAGMLLIVHRHRQRRARGGVLLQLRDLPLQLGEPLVDPLELGLGSSARLRPRFAGSLLVGGLRSLLQGVLLRLELLLLLRQAVERPSRAPGRPRRRPGRPVRADAGSSP